MGIKPACFSSIFTAVEAEMRFRSVFDAFSICAYRASILLRKDVARNVRRYLDFSLPMALLPPSENDFQKECTMASSQSLRISRTSHKVCRKTSEMPVGTSLEKPERRLLCDLTSGPHSDSESEMSQGRYGSSRFDSLCLRRACALQRRW